MLNRWQRPMGLSLQALFLAPKDGPISALAWGFCRSAHVPGITLFPGDVLYGFVFVALLALSWDVRKMICSDRVWLQDMSDHPSGVKRVHAEFGSQNGPKPHLLVLLNPQTHQITLSALVCSMSRLFPRSRSIPVRKGLSDYG